ncbi:O-acetyl-ADP-ribose deacetylase (regulator of RNase III) [Mucilaginibacter lappiensis]
MIICKKGNLLADEAEALVNTVNTVGVMGKGIALAFKNAFPHNYAQYKHACNNGAFFMGSILAVKDISLLYGEKVIVNFPTKTLWRNPSRYGYIETGLAELRAWMIETKIKSIAIPALGCENGGLDWQIVKPMIVNAIGDLDMQIAIYGPS